MDSITAVYDVLVYCRIVVPNKKTDSILWVLHEGHLSIGKYGAKAKVWWPGDTE